MLDTPFVACKNKAAMHSNDDPKKVVKRLTILKAAIDVFGKKGFQDTTISEIARKAGVSEGNIYQYFKNKEDLFFAIPIEKTKEFRSQLELHMGGILGALNKLRKFVWYFLYFFSTNPEYGRMLMLEMRVNRSFVKTETYDFLKKSVAMVMEIIEEGQKTGEIRKDVNVYVMRHLILGILEHVVTRWLLKEQKYDLLDQYQEISQLLIDALKDPKLKEGVK